MKFIINQQSLSKALSLVTKGISTRTTLPILQGILIEVTDDNVLKLSSSDLAISVQTSVNVLEGKPGKIVVMAKLFNDIIKKLPNAPVSFVIEENTVSIRCMNSNFNVVGISPNEFPEIAVDSFDSEECSEVILDKKSFSELIKKTSYAASTDDSKGIITGLKLEIEYDKLNIASIDGYRLAVARKDITSDIESEIVIEAKLMNEISKILSESEDDTVTLMFSKKCAKFTTGNTVFTSRLLEGNFVDYKQLINQKNPSTTLVVNREDLTTSVERAAIFGVPGKRYIKLRVNGNEITITSKSEEGNIVETVKANKEGEDITIGANADYLLPALKSIEDTEIKLEMTSPISPILFKPLEGDSFDALVLPVRLANE